MITHDLCEKHQMESHGNFLSVDKILFDFLTFLFVFVQGYAKKYKKQLLKKKLVALEFY
jgi:hypothetical protein